MLVRVLFLGAPIAPHPDPQIAFEDKFEVVGYNTGNLLIGQSLFEELRFEEFGQGLAYSPHEVNERFDIIAIAAANFIYKDFDLSYLSDFIEPTKLPCVVAGLGAQAPAIGNKVTDIPEGSKRFLRVISERSKTVGVRGHFTAEVMNDFGIKNVTEIGCPSLFRKLRRDLKIKRPRTGAKLKIAVNGSRNVFVHSGDPEAARRVEADLLKVSIDNHYPYVLQNEELEMRMLLSRDKPEIDFENAQAVLNEMNMDVEPLRYTKHIKKNAKVFFDLAQWDKFISKVDYSIGTRFHGNLIALTNGVPATIISHDSRTTEMAELMSIPHVPVGKVRRLDVHHLAQVGDYDGFQRNYTVLYDRFAQFLLENGISHRLEQHSAIGAPSRLYNLVSGLRLHFGKY
ncbi:polysaccharide pyruvyl transferase family protein [Mesorhizobium sp. M8A.F.Ca.ET.161.01.1.1]|nr:polysaccharide pyruvyl transferase family protein [Mesorhizobium sp. M8A.F.Ca.ET.023.02.2.1]RWC69423.1 MAG: polysaccharide pyruvyl transferase family protein [Mesorhizobium sp.]TGT85102.1 polysaccharide pyruvyl transferase family protein [Mesorhizobium sp. M8A.F.Ca.ET.161.01.1.1]TGV13720.1 polysaccharide pyruvyl transferase family protein [Mesorhizobium sp. M8A.F.Ca.ET.173.01.1.1]TGV39045.1 polysaccharide pyruvyl transferase family protein [Mesorhizobium sp. M8A.F.Ca.ET.142.01.1.1]